MKLNKMRMSAAICLVLGLVIFIAGFSLLGFDIAKLGTDTPYEAQSFASSGQVRAIYIEDGDADIEISPSADDRVHITYYENKTEYYDITESAQGDLVIQTRTQRKWYDYIFVVQLERQPTLQVEVPDHFNGDITVKSYDGSVAVKDIGVSDLLLSSSDGSIEVRHVAASGRLEAKAADDSIYMSDTTAAEAIFCRASNGEIELNAILGRTIEAENTDGKITLMSVASTENISLKASDGDIRLDDVEFGEALTCTATDGNVVGTVTGKLVDYSVTAKALDGKSNLPESMSGGDKVINIKASDGDIRIDFLG